jgi:predicted anti-sigma-YlaC factor YlaD
MTCEALDERLDDWVDGTLPAAQAREVETHLACCPLCRERERRLRQVLAHAAALPRSVAPPRDLWPSIAREIERERAWSRGRLGWWSPVALAAAAAVVVGLLAVLVHQRTPAAVQTAVIPAAAPSAGVAGAHAVAGGIDPSLVAMERDYQAAANALLGALQARKASLAPETLASVERNLAVMDEALAEVRRALEKDPENPDLSRMLVATHRKKVDVLRRVVKLSTVS